MGLAKSMKGRKAQVEIVGLLIIVLMISFILLFVFKAVVNKDDSEYTSTKNENLATSIIIAMINTDTNCNPTKPKVKTLLTDCAKWYYGGAGSGNIKCTNGMDSCDYVNQTLQTMLSHTLLNWSKTYEMYIFPPGAYEKSDVLIYKTGGNLTKAGSGQTGVVPLPVSQQGDMEIKLCIGRCA